MADEGLKDPVLVQATRLDSTVLPAGFSQAFRLYLIQQGFDFSSVAGRANDAGMGAYDAQVRNDEQDVILDDHEKRITEAEETLIDHEQRITQAEITLTDHEQRITANEQELQNHEQRISQSEQDINSLEGRVDSAEQDIDALQLDYVSKTAIPAQSLASPIDVATSYSVNGTQVVGVRQTGFTAATGTALKGAFNANATFTVSATYTQSEVQAMATALIATRQRVKAREDAMRTHGLID